GVRRAARARSALLRRPAVGDAGASGAARGRALGPGGAGRRERRRLPGASAKHVAEDLGAGAVGASARARRFGTSRTRERAAGPVVAGAPLPARGFADGRAGGAAGDAAAGAVRGGVPGPG